MNIKMKMGKEIVNLHIENLILEGVAEKDRTHVAEGVRRELSRLLTEGGVPAGLREGRTIPSIAGGTYSVVHGAKPQANGESIARAIYAGMAGSGG